MHGNLLLKCGEKTEQRYRHVPVPFWIAGEKSELVRGEYVIDSHP
jgi:hypothetical protein